MKKKFLVAACVATMAMGCAMTANAADLSDGLVSEFLFEDYTDGIGNGSATEIGDGNSLEKDSDRGNVVSMSGGTVTKVKGTDNLYTSTAPSGLQMPSSIISENDFTKGFTLTMWMKSVGANGFSGIADISDQNGAYSWGHMELAAAPQLRFNGWGLNEVAGDDWFETGTWPADVKYWLGDEGWEMFTLSVSESQINIYVNDKVLYTDADVTHCKRILQFLDKLGDTGRTSFRLGTFITPGNWDWNWDAYKGMLDDVRVYNRAITEEEVGAIMNVGADVSVVDSNQVNTDPSVYVQYKKQTDGKYTVRVVGEVSLEGTFAESVNNTYNGVGFRCAKSASAVAAAESYASTVVFKSLVANGATVTAADGKYFVVTEITDVAKDATIYASPVYVKADKTVGTFTDKEYTIKMADIIK